MFKKTNAFSKAFIKNQCDSTERRRFMVRFYQSESEPLPGLVYELTERAHDSSAIFNAKLLLRAL
jgi:hypothetical protein